MEFIDLDNVTIPTTIDGLWMLQESEKTVVLITKKPNPDLKQNKYVSLGSYVYAIMSELHWENSRVLATQTDWDKRCYLYQSRLEMLQGTWEN